MPTLYIELDRVLPSQSCLPTVLHMSGQLKGDNRTLMFQELLGAMETFQLSHRNFWKIASCFTTNGTTKARYLKMLLPSGKRSHSDGWKIPHLFIPWEIHRLNQRVHFPASYVSLPEGSSINFTEALFALSGRWDVFEAPFLEVSCFQTPEKQKSLSCCVCPFEVPNNDVDMHNPTTSFRSQIRQSHSKTQKPERLCWLYACEPQKKTLSYFPWKTGCLLFI